MRRGKILLLSVLGMAMTACTYKMEQEPVVYDDKQERMIDLKIAYSRDDITWSLVMDDLCSNFEDRYPDINLEFQDVGNQIYEEGLKISEALEEFPDLFEIQNIEEYIKNDRLAEIPQGITELLEEPRKVEGKIYTVPVYTTTYGILYNQVLFKKYNLSPPSTYNEFLQICQALKDQGIIPLTCGGTEEDSILYWLNYFSLKNENDIVSMLEEYEELLKSGYVLKDSVYMNNSQIISQLVDSKVAMYYTKPSFVANVMLADPDCLSSMRDNFGNEIDDEEEVLRLAWFFVPMDDGNVVATKEIGAQFAISKDCKKDPKKYEAAELFLKFLFEDENYREILKSMYGFQTTKKRVLYPAPFIQQYLIVDYRYAQKGESFMDANHISEEDKNKFSRILYLMASNSMTVEEMRAYFGEN